MKKILAVILARSGSKGLKNKNLRKLGKKPLVSWSIDEAKKSKKIDMILLSTDSQKIAKIGIRKKIYVPFLRPKNLSGDKTPSVDALEHSINFLKDRGKKFDYIILLEPTSPFRSYIDIDNSLNNLIRSNASSLVSICKTDSLNPLFLFKKRREFLIPIKKSKRKYLRRQDIEPTYFLDGSIYISKISSLLKERTFCHNNTIGYEVPKWKSIEIDDMLDLELAKIILKNRHLRKSG